MIVFFERSPERCSLLYGTLNDQSHFAYKSHTRRVDDDLDRMAVRIFLGSELLYSVQQLTCDEQAR